MMDSKHRRRTSEVLTLELVLRDYVSALALDIPCLKSGTAKVDYIKETAAHIARLVVPLLTKDGPPVVVSWPADWWQHFKLRWAPRWFLGRWPVQYESRTLTPRAVFPDLIPDGARGNPPRFFVRLEPAERARPD